MSTSRHLSLASLVAATLLSTACHQETLKYPHSTPEACAQAVSEAFNRTELPQLRLLTHPDRRTVLDDHGLDLRQQMKTYDIQSYRLGDRLEVEIKPEQKREGRALHLVFSDGYASRENEAVLAFDGGAWWLWKY